MSDINDYLDSTYKDGGRGEVEVGRRSYDCWGLTRSVRHEVFGLPLMPSYGPISADDKRRLTQACLREARAFRPGDPAHAAIATVWRSGLCVHIGICVEIDGRLGVLETNKQTGPRWLAIADFARRYSRVIYYS